MTGAPVEGAIDPGTRSFPSFAGLEGSARIIHHLPFAERGLLSRRGSDGVLMSFRAAPLQSRTDEEVRALVTQELRWDPRITDNDIAVAVREGVVTLSGFCRSYWEKGEAERAAKRVYGVKGLANDIEVRTVTTRTDPEIARDVVHEIESHVVLPTTAITASVEDGTVRLEGKVDWQYQRNIVESAVRKLKGVRRLINEIEIVPQASAIDVRSRIEEALRRSAEVDARRIRVEVSDAVVRLYGNVRSWNEREDAERAAWSAPGTTRVENHIRVTP